MGVSPPSFVEICTIVDERARHSAEEHCFPKRHHYIIATCLTSQQLQICHFLSSRLSQPVANSWRPIFRLWAEREDWISTFLFPQVDGGDSSLTLHAKATFPVTKKIATGIWHQPSLDIAFQRSPYQTLQVFSWPTFFLPNQHLLPHQELKEKITAINWLWMTNEPKINPTTPTQAPLPTTWQSQSRENSPPIAFL